VDGSTRRRKANFNSRIWYQLHPHPPERLKFSPNVSKLAVFLQPLRAMSLIIRDQLVTPPTWFSSFRDLTLYCHIFLRADVLIESNDPDPYWKWIRARGGMDFVEDFVRPGTEAGVRLDVEPNYPRSVITDRIAPENLHQLISRIRYCGSLQ
jgi:hypothetical protein